MGFSYARAEIIGNLGRDPEMRYTPSGQAVTHFSLAVSHGRKVGDQWENETDWYNIVVWGAQAEMVNEKLAKGVKVHVGGVLRNRKYENSGGEKRTICEIVARDVTILTPSSRAGSSTDSSGGDDSLPFGSDTAQQTVQQMADSTEVAEPDW